VSYVDECSRNERMGVIWLKAGISKLEGLGRDLIEEGAFIFVGGECCAYTTKIP
jgi:hypothetical protein